MLKYYGSMALADVEADSPADWDFGAATHARVRLPAAAAYVLAMQQAGFFWADRTLQATIVLARCGLDLDKVQRLPVVETREYRDDIARIACTSFPEDRRFHITPACSADVAALVVREAVAELGAVLVCLWRDKAVGFLALRRMDAETFFVHLAAVEEQYRMSGAGMSLYAAACKQAKALDGKRLVGRISSLNTAVMNVYAAFGAAFSAPMDIYLKECRHDA